MVGLPLPECMHSAAQYTYAFGCMQIQQSHPTLPPAALQCGHPDPQREAGCGAAHFLHCPGQPCVPGALLLDLRGALMQSLPWHGGESMRAQGPHEHHPNCPLLPPLPHAAPALCGVPASPHQRGGLHYRRLFYQRCPVQHGETRQAGRQALVVARQRSTGRGRGRQCLPAARKLVFLALNCCLTSAAVLPCRCTA